MLPFKTRRTSQPQGAVEIDLSNRLGKTVSHIAVGGNWGGSSVGPPSIKATSKGLAHSFDASAKYLISDAKVTGYPFTFALLVRRKSLTDQGTIIGMGAASNDRHALYFAGGTLYFFSGAGGSYDQFGPNFAITETENFHTIVGVALSATNRLLYLDGVLVGSSAVSISPAPANKVVIGAYWTSGAPDLYFNGDIPIAAVCKSAWRPADAKDFHDNPNQLLKPISRSLWIPGAVSGGSSHTLTGANSTQSSTSGTGAVSQSHLLTGASCSQSATSGTGAITQGATHILTGANSTQAALSGTGVITQGHMLVGAGATQSASSGVGAIAQTHLLTGAGSSQTAASGTGAIIAGAVHVLTAAGASQAATSSTGAITQRHILVCPPSVQDSTASASAIVQAHMLVAAACSQAAVSGVGAITSSAPGLAYWPTPAQVLAGVQYGPTGANYTGTLTGGTGPSAADIAAAVLAAAQASPIWADARRMNGAVVQGDGSEANLWRGASV